MKSVKVCHSCDQVDKQWDKLFDEVCSKYENVYHELQKVQAQLATEKAKQKSQKQFKVLTNENRLFTKAQLKSNSIQKNVTNTNASTQTIPRQTAEIGVQTHTEASTQTIRRQTAEVGVQTEADIPHADQTQGMRSTSSSPQKSDENLVELDHSYADPQAKPFNCNYCSFKSARKFNVEQHGKSCKARLSVEGQNAFEIGEILHECRVCAKLYSYDQLRKHYLHFIKSTTQRKNRNGHDKVSKETHKLLLTQLKEQKKQ